MRLTKEEKEICEQYSKRDENNTVHCYECPLVINKTWTLCKANCRAEEWRDHNSNCASRTSVHSEKGDTDESLD